MAVLGEDGGGSLEHRDDRCELLLLRGEICGLLLADLRGGSQVSLRKTVDLGRLKEKPSGGRHTEYCLATCMR